MKNLSIILSSLIISAIALYSCEKQTSGNGYFAVKMTDAPGDYDSVNVEIIGTEIHYSNGSGSGWVTLPTVTGIYNLLDLQNDITAVLVDPNIVPAGDIQQLRLILGDENTVVVDSVSYPLLLSSQDKTGLKINVNTFVNPGDSVEILIDFDADQSIVQQGNGQYRLKPVVKLENVTYF
jgi:hypothetical protein